jgi:hypothetical protein
LQHIQNDWVSLYFPARLAPDDDAIKYIILMFRTTGVGNLIDAIKYLRDRHIGVSEGNVFSAFFFDFANNIL